MIEIPIGALLRQARRKADFSQRQLAEKAGVSKSYIAALESTAKAETVRLRTLVRILEVTGYEISIVDVNGRRADPLWDGPRDRAGRRYPAHLDIRRVYELADWWGWLHFSSWANPPMPDYTFDLDRGIRDVRRDVPCVRYDTRREVEYEAGARDHVDPKQRSGRWRVSKPLVISGGREYVPKSLRWD